MVFIPTIPAEAPPGPPPLSLDEELRVNRFNTIAFIAAEPLVLTLSVRGSARTPSGAYGRERQAERPAQTFRLLLQSPAGGRIEQRTADGTERQVDFVLLGRWDAEIDVSDYWDDELGQRWEVTSLIPSNGYETRAVVEAHGKRLYGG
jgi:hypothetical protein